MPDKWQNSWYLKTGLAHNFICKCGQMDSQITIVSTIHHPDHRCSQCGNDHYLDSVAFLTDERMKYWSSFYWDYTPYMDERGWSISAVAKIPVFDYPIQKIIMKEISIASISMMTNGTQRYTVDHSLISRRMVYNGGDTIQTIDNLIQKEIYQKLYDCITSHPGDLLGWIESEKTESLLLKKRLNLFSFFLVNRHLKELDFFFWGNFWSFQKSSRKYPTVTQMLDHIHNNRKEKSIKRSYFHSYHKAIVEHYNPKADYLFSRLIEDPNHLREYIAIDHQIKNQLFDDIRAEDVIAFFTFLKRHYADKSIKKLWIGLTLGTVRGGIVRDTIRMFSDDSMQNVIERHFRKPAPNFDALHEEFIRLNRLRKIGKRGRLDFGYHPNDIKAQADMDDYSFKLPQTVYLLDEWARKLHNCMFSYSNAIKDRRTVIYGVFVQHTLKYAIEIKGDRIVQALGVSNSGIGAEDREVIDRWFRDVYLRGWITENV